MNIRITWLRALLTLIGAALLGLLFAWSGVIPIGASSGHWRITDWGLHWAMENSVRTHTILQSPDLKREDDGLVSAAGHFAQSCAACHGAPGVLPLPVMRAATPHAPNLQVNAPKWTDAQLFYILDHGVKFTGMPFWAARDRPDEIRRMVAFVRALPGMTPERYRALVQGPDRAVQGLSPGTVAKCTGCHGADGMGRGQADIPILAGQKPAYLLDALRRYQTNRRSSAVMRQAAAQLRPEEMVALARHFAAMPIRSPQARPVPNGERAHFLAERGLPEWELPSCLSCHDPRRPGTAPILHGQRAAYLAARLERWRGSEYVVEAKKSRDVMPTIARRIPKEMIDPLARHFEAAPHPAGTASR
jgi:cytochrome c553